MNKNITTQAHRQTPDNRVQKSNEVGLSAVIDETKNRAAVRCSAWLGDESSILRSEILSVATETQEFLRSSTNSCYDLITLLDRLYPEIPLVAK